MQRGHSSGPRSALRRTAQLLLAAAVAVPVAILPAVPAAAAPPSTADWKVTPLSGTKVNAATAPSGRMARTDPSLLNQESATSIPVVVKLDYDALAAYSGGLSGFAPTSPRATGRTLNRKHPDVSRYETHVADMEDRFLKTLRSRLPQARVGRTLRTVYGGVALRVPANQVETVLGLPGAVAVQKDDPQQLLTDSSGAFIGASTLYRQLGSDITAGQGVIVANIDTGVWPEHPSFGARGDLPPPPARADGAVRSCEFGDNPVTVPTDPLSATPSSSAARRSWTATTAASLTRCTPPRRGTPTVTGHTPCRPRPATRSRRRRCSAVTAGPSWASRRARTSSRKPCATR